MVIHHSLNNTLWDPKRRLLDITNERAAREFTEILLRGITTNGAQSETIKRQSSAARPAQKKKK
jgi:hypothetical protein